MKSSKKCALGVAALAGLVFAANRASSEISQSELVYDVTNFIGTMPEDTPYTLLDMTAALRSGGPPPPGWTSEKIARTKAMTTGLVDPASGDIHTVVTIKVDASPKLNEAWLYVDNQLEIHATRANGKIIDRSGFALATLSFFRPTSATSVRLEWDNDAGDLSGEEVIF